MLGFNVRTGLRNVLPSPSPSHPLNLSTSPSSLTLTLHPPPSTLTPHPSPLTPRLLSHFNGKPRKVVSFMKAIGFQPALVTVGALNNDGKFALLRP